MIMGRDLIRDLHLIMDFDKNQISCSKLWFKERTIPMKRMRDIINFNPFFEDLFFLKQHKSSATEHLTKRAHTISKASYKNLT